MREHPAPSLERDDAIHFLEQFNDARRDVGIGDGADVVHRAMEQHFFQSLARHEVVVETGPAGIGRRAGAQIIPSITGGPSDRVTYSQRLLGRSSRRASNSELGGLGRVLCRWR